MKRVAAGIMGTVLAALVGLVPRGTLGQCCGDCNGNSTVTIDEILTAVNSALNGCAAQDVSVCGGPITSTPKICSLRLSPNPGRHGQGFTLEWSWSDLEGDIDRICYTFLSAGGFGPDPVDLVALESHCVRANRGGSRVQLDLGGVGYAWFTLPFEGLINGPFVSDIGHTGGHVGVYVLSIFVIDGAAHISNTETIAVARLAD